MAVAPSSTARGDDIVPSFAGILGLAESFDEPALDETHRTPHYPPHWSD